MSSLPDDATEVDRRLRYERLQIQHFFDSEFYLNQITGPAPSDPITHYLTIGWKQALNPAPWFSTEYYLATYEDVQSARVNPFVHYVEVGRSERRHTTKGQHSPKGDSRESAFVYERSRLAAYFRADFYISRNFDLDEFADDPLGHFLVVGWQQARDPTPWFSTSHYLSAYRDVKESGKNPLLHFVESGQLEGRQTQPGQNADSGNELSQVQHSVAYERRAIAPDFDVLFYLDQNTDLRDEAIDPLQHFIDYGWRELRDPSPTFSVRSYLAAYPDVRDLGINPLLHYIESGRLEGRYPNPEVISKSTLAARMADGYHDISSAFDADFYIANSPDLQGANVDLVSHYMTAGWKELRNPNSDFSTSYYLDSNPDVRAGGGNPFLHYLRHGLVEGRHGLPFQDRLRRIEFQPLVTVIVPNYNHALFLRKRLDSILSQTYRNYELIILDDCSTDNSREIIAEYQTKHPELIKPIYNQVNSGNVFKQWRRGIEAAKGAFIWICESDDLCASNFLEKCVRPMVDRSVMIAFGRVQFCDIEDEVIAGLDSYREAAEPGIWDGEIVRSAYEWFNGSFAKANLIPNVGGCVFRAQPVSQAVWEQLAKYKIVGDWYLYCVLAAGGRLAYLPDAVAYFRQHGRNTSVSGFLKPHYYQEHERLMVALRQQWGTPEDVAAELFRNTVRQFRFARAHRHVGKLSNLYSNDRVMSTERTNRHVLVCSLGFHLGGGEIFPVHLANELVRRGFIVSFLCLDTRNENDAIAKQLDGRIAIYDAQLATEMGVSAFALNIGADLVHSHTVAAEFLFFHNNRLVFPHPYIVTLHGSYEVTPVPDEMLLRLIRGVSSWVYLSKKNLAHLRGIPLAEHKLVQLPNGLAKDNRPAPFTRAELGIGPEDVVFTLASRAIESKGWRIAVDALRLAQPRSPVQLHLILCGAGPESDRLKAECGEASGNVHIVGFQEEITGIYEISDVAILPTRFAGESFPLTIIQALQVARPVIATGIGEIASMLTDGDDVAGSILEADPSDGSFTSSLTAAMLRMTDATQRRDAGQVSQRLGKRFSIERVADDYLSIYNREWLETERYEAHVDQT